MTNGDKALEVACNIHNMIFEMTRPESEWFGQSRETRVDYQLHRLANSIEDLLQ